MTRDEDVPSNGDAGSDGETGTDATPDGETVADAPAYGRRIAELLASELSARDDGPLAGVVLADVDRDVVPDEFGVLAYRVHLEAAVGDGDDRHVADCFVHDDRVRLEFVAGLDRLPEVAEGAGLRVRPRAAEPPRVIVFVEDTAQVKRVLPVVGAAGNDVRDGD